MEKILDNFRNAAKRKAANYFEINKTNVEIQTVKIIATQFSRRIRYRRNSALHGKESKIKNRRRKIAQPLLSREALQLCRSEKRTPFSSHSFLELFVRIFWAFLPICFRSS